MYLLDTDHLSEIIAASGPGESLKYRLDCLDVEIATSIVAFEEMLRGWLAKIHHEPKPRQQVSTYRRLYELMAAFASWEVFVWDEECAEIFERMTSQRVNVKPMDLKIATIVLRNNATLLSRNLKDFQRVPGLVVEDWLSPRN